MDAPAPATAVAPLRRALLSVSDKRGLLSFARDLAAAGVELVSTGGTCRMLQEHGVPVIDVAQYTGFPEMMDGRVKTLHPKVHGGILFRRDVPAHVAAAQQHGIAPFDLVAVNLYPFEQTVARSGTTREEAVEQIDIGGPSMVRSAAKNHAFVAVATDPSQYDAILDELRERGGTTLALRQRLAQAAFARTAAYDAAIAAYLAPEAPPAEAAALPPPLQLQLVPAAALRYGENPHQRASLYAAPDAAPQSLVRAEQLHGKELSYNNLLDLDAALGVVRLLPTPSVAVLKHNTPCGAAAGATVGEALAKAWEGDPLSAFGSILGFNACVDAAAAAYLAEPGRFVEAIVAPDYAPEALEILTTVPKWKANVRLLRTGEITPGGGRRQVRSIDGGYLVQDADDLPDDPAQWQLATSAAPAAPLRRDLEFAWELCRHVKSNAIVLVRDQMLVGAGAGQMSRVDAVEIALRKAGQRAQGAVLASDAFFPFDDSIHTAARAGVAAFIQPGGSRRDDEVIAACNQHGLPMLFTGRRHFRH
jgi:phosphoribosylaminoimidazolecarboxamide formyltransferase/IMP cyclohydrolase